MNFNIITFALLVVLFKSLCYNVTEILCPQLPFPSNGFLNFPCENQVGSVCTFSCDPGYFMEKDVVVECLLTGLWNNTGPVCTRIQACNPSPCVTGVCHLSQNEPGGYSYDCTGTGYAGKNCGEGYVTTPSWPEIWVGSEYNNLVFIAKPKQSLGLDIIVDSDKVNIEPIQLSFTSAMQTQNVSVRGISQGFVTISYVLRGTEAADFSAPEDDEMFVYENNYLSDHHERFTAGYQLPSGCYVLSDQSTCVSLISTEEWMGENNASTPSYLKKSNFLKTTGIVSVATNEIEFPLSFTGHSATQHMPVTTTHSNCDSDGLTLGHIQDFVQLNSLYRNYTRQLENILLDWITFISVNIDPLDAKTSFSTFSFSGAEVKSIEWCSSAPVISDGLYSVYLLQNSSMIVGGRRVSLPMPPFKGKYCLIVGVCNVTYGTVMMVFPEGSRNILSYADDIKQDGSIEVDANCLAFSKTDRINPNGKYGEQEEQISILVNMQYSYNVNKSSVFARIEGSGDLYVKLENTKQLFSHLFLHRWVLQQFGDSKIILFWKVLGKHIKLEFKSTQMHSPILNASIGVNCPPGSYRGNNELPAICQPCPVGYYQPNQGQNECLRCYGDSGPDAGSRTCMPVICEPGSYLVQDEFSTSCQSCPVGYYQPKQDQSECLKCYGDSGPHRGSRTCRPVEVAMPTESVNQPTDYALVYVIGGAVGGSLCLFLVVCFIIYYVWRKNRKKEY